ncbi:AAA family ATPase [Candidatus Dojkabacteria bacterium]|uniref:AAA family ATPase n=1 Tax=Candidatus Dojkabacteria bacterium TaxID=2099670 RepID=A0A955L9C2_9BACT|nr:AAA family ATPase [Candidatus Dojkabacteria bacterium]
MITFTDDQKHAIEAVLDWYSSKKRPFITLGGYAGTGKTTILGYIRNELRKKKVTRVAFCAYTGKAARVLESKLTDAQSLNEKDRVSTIHSLIYKALTNTQGEVIGWDKRIDVAFDLIIVDEASMVDEYIWQDLLSFGIPILAVGDHGQLYPIQGKFSLMRKPDITLEKIHRQAEGNPIIHVSMLARKEGAIPITSFSKIVKKFDRYDPETGSEIEDMFYGFDENMLILCGYNKTRIQLNSQVRQQLGFEGQGIEVGERVICLKNNHQEGLVNGLQGYIVSLESINEFHYSAEISFDDTRDVFKGKILKAQFDSPNLVTKLNGIHPRQFGGQFDKGYAVTVHKAQGSQARRVILFEERFPQMSDDDWRRWLYTGVTRAEEELFIIGR